MGNYEFIKTRVEEATGIIELHRPDVLNALNRKMVDEIVEALERYDQSEDIRVIVITGSQKVFAAGADIDEMADDTPVSMELRNQFAVWDRISLVKKPVIAAVNGYALGGAFELVLNCDLIFAGETAKFGFPEINLGVMPGAGGTQRLAKTMGKAKALEWLWTGEHMSAKEAYQYGVINKVVAPEILMDEVLKYTAKLSRQAPLSVRLIKEAVNKVTDSTLEEGLLLERKNFYLLFGSEDQKEGMKAFIEKRKPDFKGK
jgi:enoyl-CoA hydratase